LIEYTPKSHRKPIMLSIFRFLIKLYLKINHLLFNFKSWQILLENGRSC
jgi:hypothetical protein